MPYQVKLPPTPRHPMTLEQMFAAAAARHPRVPVAPPDPKAGLWRLLDRLEGIRAAGARIEQHELVDKILDLFHDFPRDAPGWLAEWRAAHPDARLG